MKTAKYTGDAWQPFCARTTHIKRKQSLENGAMILWKDFHFPVSEDESLQDSQLKSSLPLGGMQAKQ